MAHAMGTGKRNPGERGLLVLPLPLHQGQAGYVLQLLGLKPGTNGFMTLEGLSYQKLIYSC